MKPFFKKRREPSFEAALIIILVVISIFSFGYYTENNITGMAVREEGLEKVTGNMVKVTGMAAKEYKITSSTGTVYTVKAEDQSTAEKEAAEKYGIKIASATASTPATTAGKSKYYAYFKDGSYEEIYTSDKTKPTAAANNIAKAKGTSLIDGAEAVTEPKYKITLNGVSTTVEAQSAAEALAEYKKTYSGINTASATAEEIKPGIQTESKVSTLVTYVVTYSDKTTTTVGAKDEASAKSWAEATKGTKTVADVKEQEYTVTYKTTDGKTVTKTVTSTQLTKLKSDLDELKIAYQVSDGSGKESCVNCQTYLIPLADGGTTKIQFNSQEEANAYVQSGKNSLVDKSKSAVRVYADAELTKLNLKTTEYTTDTGAKVYLNTKTNTLQVAPDDGTDNFAAYTGTISKISTIGDEKDANSVKIREWFNVKDGNKESNVASTSIISNENQDIPIDKETLTLIKSTVTGKGTVSSAKNADGSSEIKFTNKNGQETSRITYSKGYKIESNKLTGTKSQVDFEYTLDTNHDGTVSKEEKDANKYEKLTTEFTATKEKEGVVEKMWYTSDFSFGSDGVYFTDMYMQNYKQDENGRTIPDGDPVYYYVEGGKKDDSNAGELNIKMNEQGEPITDGGKVLKVEKGKVTDTSGGAVDKEVERRAINRESQSTSRRWFSNLEFKLTQYKGLSGWSQLIFSDETLSSWREGVDKFFSSFYLGTEYWASKICSKYIPKDQNGILTMKTKDGLFDVIAHAEGEKTVITAPNGTKEYIYKLTFSVRNPKNSAYNNLKFNVYLYGERTVKLYEGDIKVEDDKSFTRGSSKKGEESKPIIQYSNYNYDRICIKLADSITNAEGGKEDEVCNSIVEYSGSSTSYPKSSGASSSSASSSSGEEADF